MKADLTKEVIKPTKCPLVAINKTTNPNITIQSPLAPTIVWAITDRTPVTETLSLMDKILSLILKIPPVTDKILAVTERILAITDRVLGGMDKILEVVEDSVRIKGDTTKASKANLNRLSVSPVIRTAAVTRTSTTTAPATEVTAATTAAEATTTGEAGANTWLDTLLKYGREQGTILTIP